METGLEEGTEYDIGQTSDRLVQVRTKHSQQAEPQWKAKEIVPSTQTTAAEHPPRFSPNAIPLMAQNPCAPAGKSRAIESPRSDYADLAAPAEVPIASASEAPPTVETASVR